MTGLAIILYFCSSIPLQAELFALTLNVQIVTGRQSERTLERDRERRAAREQFSNNFRELQLLGISLLKAHERRELKAARLSKDSKAIQKKARAVRALSALGEPNARPKEYGPKIISIEQFDRSIRELSYIIYRFAHNPIHKNSKVFDMDLASQASSDLVNIINLAKVIEDNAEGYAPAAGGN